MKNQMLEKQRGKINRKLLRTLKRKQMLLPRRK